MSNTRNKGRPAQVSLDEIVLCALNMGLHDVSMHAIGKQLGVSATALYRHVSSKDALIERCCDHVIAQIALPEEQDWQRYLSTFAERFRAALLSLPGSVEFVRHNQQFTQASCVLVEDVLEIFRRANISLEVGFMAFACVYTRVTDLVQHQEQSTRQASSDKTPQETLAPQAFPNLSLLMSQTKPLDYEQYFKDGITITLAGLDAVYGS